MASNKPNKLAFLSMLAPASYVAGLSRGLFSFSWYFDPAHQVPLVSSLPVLIPVPFEKVLLPRRLPCSSSDLILFAERPEPGEEKIQK